MQPLLFDSTGAVILLALSTALGAYIRGVYASAADSYDKTAVADTWHGVLWPRDATYTERRLRNLQRVMSHLQAITWAMFAFVFLASLRLIASGLNNDACGALSAKWFGSVVHILCPAAQSRSNLALADLALGVGLALAFIGSFFAHWVGSRAEKKVRRQAHDEYERKRKAKLHEQSKQPDPIAKPSRESASS